MHSPSIDEIHLFVKLYQWHVYIQELNSSHLDYWLIYNKVQNEKKQIA